VIATPASACGFRRNTRPWSIASQPVASAALRCSSGFPLHQFGAQGAGDAKAIETFCVNQVDLRFRVRQIYVTAARLIRYMSI